MKSHWIKRIVRLLVLLFGVSILCFILTALSSTDPATYLVRRGNLSPTPEVIEQVRAELGLDQPLPIRYLNWIGGVFRGDFGESIFSTNEVAADLAAYFPQTLQLVFLSLAEIIVFSILLGVLCAAKKNKLTDHIMRIVSLFGICVPPFWLGFLLLIGFAVEIPIFSVTPASGIMGLILPSITLSFPVICSTVRVFRASLLEEMHRDYVSFARANGMTVNRILWKKVFRNALPPVITLFCQYVSYLIAGSAVVEKVFSIKGVGNYLMNCIMAADANAIGACMLRKAMLRKIWRNPQAVIGLGLIVLICAVAILAPLLAPHAPDEVNPLMKYQAPSADYPLGTDQLGRCELSRLLYGARASLGLALPILILLGGIGLILGMMTACIGGWFDRIVTGISQVFIAFPTLIIAVAIIGVLGNGLQNIIWAVVISMWARFMQLIRTYAKTELGRDYIVAARVSGCGMWQLIVHHLIPNILPQFLVYFSTGVASAILTVSSFSFLGLGLPSGTAEWGAMLEEAQVALYSHPELLIYPGICIFIAAAGFNLFGEALRDILQPQEDVL